MIWNVYCENWNRHTVEPYDIFTHGRFFEYCQQNYKKTCKKDNEDKEAFIKQLKSDLMYCFWSKCEYEIQLAPWPFHEDKDKMIKVDIYDQIMLNWKVFTNYVWENRKELKPKRSRRAG